MYFNFFFELLRSTLFPSMVHSPLKHGSKKSKRRGEDTGDVSQQQKRQKAGTQLPIGPGSSLAHQPRRSNRTGAGTGGHAIQLERIGAAVEGPQRVSRPRTTLSADIAQNPIAPPRDKNRKKVTVVFPKLVGVKSFFYRNYPKGTRIRIVSMSLLPSILHCLSPIFTQVPTAIALVSMNELISSHPELSPISKL